MLVAALLTLPLLLVAAKAHGLHLRLEREAAGYRHVEFGGENPPFVEDLWRHDRIRYWALVLPLAVLLGAVAFPLGLSWWGVALALPWAMTAGFVATGLASAARQRRVTAQGAAWLGVTGALAAAVATATVLGSLRP
jgi:hypothetical protein